MTLPRHPWILTTVLVPLSLAALLACKGGGEASAPSRSEGLIPVLAMASALEREVASAPGGEVKAWLKRSQGQHPQRLCLFVEGTGRNPFPLRQISFDLDRNVHAVTWFSDQRVGYLKDPKGDENYRLYAVDIDGTNRRELTPPALPGVATRVLCADPAGGNRWLVAMGPAHGAKDLYWIDMVSGDYGLKERNPSNLRAWLPDGQGRILAAVAQDGLRFSLLHRPSEAAPFQTLATTTFPDLTVPIALEPGGRVAKVMSNVGRDTLALFEFDLITGIRGRLLKEAPGRDLVDLMDLDAGQSAGMRAPAPDWQRQFVADGAPPIVTPSTEKVQYQARDGETITAYLTLPTGLQPMTRPAVVHCHGGPMADTEPEDIEAMFLANRGIAVLRPHFRGSSGTGKAFLAKGLGQWGGTMQDDLTDGARWLAAMGHASPGSIGIMGASYGGYAALAGASLTPDVYRCAVAAMGPSSLLSLSQAPYWQTDVAINALQMGDPATDGARMRAVSPLFNAHRIQIPLFLAHGAQDSRVPLEESRQMVRAMAARGVFVPFMVFQNEGHGFSLEENRMEYYRALENFFGMHLGSRVEAPTAFPLAR